MEHIKTILQRIETKYFATPFHYFNSLSQDMQIKVRNHYEKLDLAYREVPVEVMQEYVKKEEKG